MAIQSRLSKRGGAKEKYQCDVCERTAMLKPGRHWCDCNPSAPFYMYPVVTRRQVEAIVAGLTGLLGNRP